MLIPITNSADIFLFIRTFLLFTLYLFKRISMSKSSSAKKENYRNKNHVLNNSQREKSVWRIIGSFASTKLGDVNKFHVYLSMKSNNSEESV